MLYKKQTLKIDSKKLLTSWANLCGVLSFKKVTPALFFSFLTFFYVPLTFLKPSNQIVILVISSIIIKWTLCKLTCATKSTPTLLKLQLHNKISHILLKFAVWIECKINGKKTLISIQSSSQTAHEKYFVSYEDQLKV